MPNLSFNIRIYDLFDSSLLNDIIFTEIWQIYINKLHLKQFLLIRTITWR